MYQHFSGNALSIQEAGTSLSLIERISDTTIYNKVENKYQEYRQLEFTRSIHGRYYKVWVRRLLIETESLASALLVLTIILFVILLVTLFLANNWVSKKIWNPFYITLEKIKGYQLSHHKSISFPKTNIEEFNELNSVIEQMTGRLKKDFSLLKEFTENTSHELQTPLAIIKSQIELLIQADNLTEAQYKNLSKSISAINKLSKLNEALGLLAKIENSQFQATESLDLTSLIESKLSNCEHLLEIKSIEVKKKMDSSFKVEMNSLLADILIENLINNSIKHNVQNGKINIEVNTREIKIFNTGIPLSYPTSELFQRFTKSNSQSLGLGLSIVKEICSQNNIKINYEYEDNWHKVTLLFG
jgi:hypothetical protein